MVNMTDWQLGFSAGVAATIVGFILTMIWDGYKYRRDTLSRESAILKGLVHELTENRELSTENIKIIRDEMEVLSKKQTLIVPLLYLKSGFWDYLKFNIPNRIYSETGMLEKLKDISLLAEHINESIRSRQNYKDTSGAMTNFSGSIKVKNEVIESNLKRLNELLDNVICVLE